MEKALKPNFPSLNQAIQLWQKREIQSVSENIQLLGFSVGAGKTQFPRRQNDASIHFWRSMKSVFKIDLLDEWIAKQVEIPRESTLEFPAAIDSKNWSFNPGQVSRILYSANSSQLCYKLDSASQKQSWSIVSKCWNRWVPKQMRSERCFETQMGQFSDLRWLQAQAKTWIRPWMNGRLLVGHKLSARWQPWK